MFGTEPWTRHQDEALIAGWANGNLSAEDVADVLMVTLDAAKNRARKLNLRKNQTPSCRLLSSENGTAKVLLRGEISCVVIIDQADVQWFLSFPGGWFAHREGAALYVWARAKPHKKLHRLLFGENVPAIVDHKNRNGLDNRRDNLRPATSAQNCYNTGPMPSRSIYKGVWLHVPSGMFRVVIKVPYGRRQSLGYYDDEITAARVYDAVALAFRGEFAFQNLPEQQMSAAEIAANKPLAAAIAKRVFAKVRDRLEEAA